MTRTTFSLGFAAFLFTALAAQAGTPDFQLVEEDVDEIVLVESARESYAKVFFIRDGAVLADRRLSAEMTLSASGHRFYIVWEDTQNGNAARRVGADQLSHFVVEASRDGQLALPWWWACHNMRDLKRP